MQTKKWNKSNKSEKLKIFSKNKIIQRMMQNTKQLGTIFVLKKDQRHRQKRQKKTSRNGWSKIRRGLKLLNKI